MSLGRKELFHILCWKKKIEDMHYEAVIIYLFIRPSLIDVLLYPAYPSVYTSVIRSLQKCIDRFLILWIQVRFQGRKVQGWNHNNGHKQLNKKQNLIQNIKKINNSFEILVEVLTSWAFHDVELKYIYIKRSYSRWIKNRIYSFYRNIFIAFQSLLKFGDFWKCLISYIEIIWRCICCVSRYKKQESITYFNHAFSSLCTRWIWNKNESV